MAKKIIRIILLGFSLMLMTQARGMPPPWPEAPFQYLARKAPISRALSDLCASFGLRLHVSEGLRGTLDGNYSAPSPGKFLDGLAASYGLVWYYHAGTLYVSRASEIVTRTLLVGKSDVAKLSAALEKLGLLDHRFGWGEFPEQGTIIVSGPPTYVDRLARTLEELNKTLVGEQVVQIFKLQNASVIDRSISFRDQQMVIPGVASVLRSIVEGSNNLPMSVSGSGKTLNPAPTIAKDPASSSDKRSEAPASNPRASSGMSASISADPRTNSVIVRADPAHMAFFESILRELDVPNILIEIEAAIVDVSTDKEDAFGVDWSLQSRHVAIGRGTPAGAGNARTVTLSWTNSIDQFLVAVKALESSGDAEILARPSVLTISNQPAVLDLSETFYIRVQGERVANAVPVSAGTMLSVTPRVVMHGEETQIQLSIDIEVGQGQPGATDGLPVVKKTTISTQAIIGEKQSLLIGGYYLNSKIKSKDKIAGLGDLPLLGSLFSNRSATQQRRERLFMIVPRIISQPSLVLPKAMSQAEPSPLVLKLDANFGYPSQVPTP